MAAAANPMDELFEKCDLGHFFTKKTFHRPVYCNHCTDMVWLLQQAYYCEVCNFIVHEKCMKLIVSPCTNSAANLIKNPVAHCWSDVASFKRKFCNVCRKKLEDYPAVRCEVCEYYVHTECQDFAVCDCKETATYTPNSSPQHNHHWREGNLPSNAKCVACKRTCWVSECLSGFRCEWCGMTIHSSCFTQAPSECDFGVLQTIVAPPYAVSVPRTDIPKNIILGIKPRGRAPTNNPSAGSLSNEYSSSGEHVAPRQEQNSSVDYGQQQQPQAAAAVVAAPPPVAAAAPPPPPPPPQQQAQPQPQLPPPQAQPQPPLQQLQPIRSERSFHSVDGTQTSPPLRKKKDEEDEEEIKVFDGNTSKKRRQYRVIALPKTAKYDQILAAALRTFHVSDDASNYYISDAYRQNDYEEPLPQENTLRAIEHPSGRRPAIFIRFREKNPYKGKIRVYPGILKTVCRSKLIEVTSTTTSREVISQALKEFGIQCTEPDKFSLVEVILHHEVSERVLDSKECPLQVLQQQRLESLRNHRLTRFYVQHRDDPHGPSVCIFVGNLPPSLSQLQYERTLMDMIKDKKLKWSKVDVIYYEYGSMVLQYNDSETALQAFKVFQQSSFDDKPIVVLLLPNIQVSIIPQHVRPLLVFVNVKSGGQQGLELITSFRKLLNPHQVFDLQYGGPLPGLYVFRLMPNYRIIVCGGDGTVGWVLSCLDNVGQDGLCQSPAMAVVPLGTGNDLARVLRWGSGYAGNEEPLNLLRDVIEADEIKLDRWTVVFHPDEKEPDETRRVGPDQGTSEDSTQMFVMNNYFGLGVDADLCLDFHMAREENPDKFSSRMHNKGVYFKMGLKKVINKNHQYREFHRDVTLEVDGKRIDLPAIQGLIILNILSWGSGANAWGQEKDDHFAKPTHYDGMLEVVGVTGVMHMAQIQSGIRSGLRLAQGGHIRIRMNAELPVQVDGEPWLQPPAEVTVLRSALKATMLRKSKSKMKRRSTESALPSGSQQTPRAPGAGLQSPDPDDDSDS